MNKRRSLTPNAGMPSAKGTHAMRRGGARQTVSDRVTFRRLPGAAPPGTETGAGAPEPAGTLREGWALNVSRGGLRAILDEDGGKVELGQEYEIFVGEIDAGLGKQGRIVWLQEEPDGFVVGVEYVAASGTHPSVPPPPPSSSAVVEAATGDEADGVSGEKTKKPDAVP